MGAVASVLAEFLGVRYWDVVKAAAAPAAIYFVSVLAMVHFWSCRLRLLPEVREGQPTVLEALKRRGHLLIPLVILVGALVVGYSPIFAAVAGIAAIFVLSWIRRDSRLTPASFLGAFEDGAAGTSALQSGSPRSPGSRDFGAIPARAIARSTTATTA